MYLPTNISNHQACAVILQGFKLAARSTLLFSGKILPDFASIVFAKGICAVKSGSEQRYINSQ
jgi:hypothetical protein